MGALLLRRCVLKLRVGKRFLDDTIIYGSRVLQPHRILWGRWSADAANRQWWYDSVSQFKERCEHLDIYRITLRFKLRRCGKNEQGRPNGRPFAPSRLFHCEGNSSISSATLL